MKFFLNDKIRRLKSDFRPIIETIEFHRKLPDYRRTPLVSIANIARRFHLCSVYLKDESSRLGLPAFKILGGSWAVWKLLSQKYDIKMSAWKNVEELRYMIKQFPPVTLVTASDGNHGRGIARTAKMLGLRAKVFMPAGTVDARVEAIKSEGGEVVIISGNYDEAVKAASSERSESAFLIQDTSWEGYEEIPTWVVEGYSTMMTEIDETLSEEKIPPPEIIFVQIGVGSLAAAVVSHFRSEKFSTPPVIIGVEPLSAACALASMQAGEIVTLRGEQDSIMAGLNCGTVATIAYPVLRDGIDCFMAIEDDYAERAMRLLADENILTSESGAAGLAGLTALMESPDASQILQHFNIDSNSNILLFLTEGVTDPVNYDRIIGRR